ncbi:hypothetical protein FGO68_gene668 [Halteria grandinella]|uniref:Uncharacterized protein n=1 Tax=Halteria grandinella TaxID=5974 RepID=A0A8J8NUV0_HALGN|nr:hypothetical protein FGO68_gene668 [Halteria grandinella]
MAQLLLIQKDLMRLILIFYWTLVDTWASRYPHFSFLQFGHSFLNNCMELLNFLLNQTEVLSYCFILKFQFCFPSFSKIIQFQVKCIFLIVSLLAQ